MRFKAYAVANEIELNRIAEKCGIPKKFTWEEPLVLQKAILSAVISKPAAEDMCVMLFSFGSVVFINYPEQDIPEFIKYLKSFEPDIDLDTFDSYTDDYELRAGGTDATEFNDSYASVPALEPYHPELVSIVVAKSVALEKTEVQAGEIFDKLESMIDRLEKGNFRISEKELARTTARIVRHVYNSISYIMILDKPDITWADSGAEDFYAGMSEFFELNDRHKILERKTDTLNNIMEGFTNISHSIRSLFVEWVIVILIVLEVVLMVADFFK